MLKLINISLTFLFIFLIKSSHSETDKELDFFKVQNYLEELKSFEANFIQMSPQGEIKKGKIFINFPGKLRISYTKPNDLLITSNGFWLVIQNLKLRQTNNIPLSQLPLDKFLNKKLVFKSDNANVKFSKNSGVISLTYSEKNNLENYSFRLDFSENPIKLKRWIIKDEFENQTTVLLQDLKIGQKYSNILFFPKDFGVQN